LCVVRAVIVAIAFVNNKKLKTIESKKYLQKIIKYRSSFLSSEAVKVAFSVLNIPFQF